MYSLKTICQIKSLITVFLGQDELYVCRSLRPLEADLLGLRLAFCDKNKAVQQTSVA
jgi:hypothetical protein